MTVQDLQDRLSKVIGDPTIAALFSNCGIDRVLVGVVGSTSTVLVQCQTSVFWWDPEEGVQVRESSPQFPFVGEFKLGSDALNFWTSFEVQFALQFALLS